jgi:cytochrome c oxidase assembly factor CtaG
MPRDVSRRGVVATSAAFGVSVSPHALFAHTGKALAPHDFWLAWTFEPVVVALVLLSAGLYARGVARLWAASEIGSGVQIWRVLSFAMGWLALVVALISPLHALGSVLFSAHMAQHEILISIAAPLLILGRPVIPFVWAFPGKARRPLAGITRIDGLRRMWTVLATPSVAFALHAIALWAWHLPGPYQATLSSNSIHSLQHTGFIFTALLFWWTILGANRGQLARGRANRGPWRTAHIRSVALVPRLCCDDGGVGHESARRPAVGRADHVDSGKHRLPDCRAGARR